MTNSDNVAPQANILIVDDEAAMLESLSELVTMAGYRVETALSGARALQCLASDHFDVMLLDLMMSGMSGHEVIEEVRRLSLDTKVVVVSGDVNFASVTRALRRGAYDFVKKPYTSDELLTTINNAVQQRALELSNQRIRQQLEHSEFLHRFIVDHSPDIVFMLDTQGRFTFLNDRVHTALGYPKDELLGTHYSCIVAAQSTEQARYVFRESAGSDSQKRDAELRLKCKANGDYRYFETSTMRFELASPPGAAETELSGTYGVARDVTERKNAQALINHQTYHDLLTKLPNRALLEDRVSLAISQAIRSKQQLAVMILDIDRFKWVNDTLGHITGDRLLQAVGQRLEASIRRGDTLARFAGDEFALLLPQIQDEGAAETIAQKLLGELREKFVVDQHELHLTGSMGIAVYPQAGETMETLIQSADIAMYFVKERQKNGYQFFTEELNEMSNSRLTLERELRNALANDNLQVCYQPQVSAATEKVVGFEALIRWQHEEHGVIYPNDFIPVAEETGLIVDLGNYVLETVCRDLAKWRAEGLPDIKVSVNFSALEIEREDFVDNIMEALRRHSLPRSCLEVEITENIIMNDLTHVIEKLRALTFLGVKIAIDDFGTGYSSLSYIQQFPINTIKIDKSFVNAIHVNESATSIVDAIVAMAKGLKLNLIAEGVETVPQLEYLKELGCNEIQGFIFGRAESEETTRAILSVSGVSRVAAQAAASEAN